MKKAFIVLMILFAIVHLQAQDYCDKIIFLDDFDLKLTTPKVGENDTLDCLNGFIVIEIIDCEGKLSFEYFNSDSLKITGQYTNSPGLMREAVRCEDLDSGELSYVGIREYYFPLQHGVWLYYYEDRIEEYSFQAGKIISFKVNR